ncbi:MAG: glutathione synthase [Gammaproteobacteria bacterium]|nr:glutathione synthase [Gammaproteobacteria bacterium]
MKIGVVMDPIEGINVKKDTTLAMLLAAQKRDWVIFYMEMNDLFVEGGVAMARCRVLQVEDDTSVWHEFGEERIMPLSDLNAILMRKDPPFDMEYIYATYILELAAQKGTLVVNNPASLRDANEKMFITQFSQCITPTLITRNAIQIKEFIAEHNDAILKPLDGMGGSSIFRIKKGDANTSVIIETLTNLQSRFVMVQKFINEISDGDKRILLINGKPVEFALARVPLAGETRGNLAAGGTGIGVELSKRDRWICEQVAPTLVEKGLIFVGLDVIGDYLTEINVTSPTCIRELDKIYGIDIASRLMDSIESLVHTPL